MDSGSNQPFYNNELIVGSTNQSDLLEEEKALNQD